jgi:hypothetical protein
MAGKVSKRAKRIMSTAMMDELGRFPMSEHPEGFRPFFIAALERMVPLKAAA